MRVPLHRISGHTSGLGVSSVPVLPGWSSLAAEGITLQSVPVGYWPCGYLQREQFAGPWKRTGWQPPAVQPAGIKWPRRLLTFFEFPGETPESFELTCSAASRGAIPYASCAAASREDANSGWTVRLLEDADVHKRDDLHYHYCRDTSGIELSFGGRKVTLRFGFQVPTRQALWQWANAQRLWGGGIAEAWQFGGHVYAGKEDRALTIEESSKGVESDFAEEKMIMVKVFAVLLKNGCAELRAHFINGELYGRGGFVEGKPFVRFESADGLGARDHADGVWQVCSHGLEAFGGDQPDAFSRNGDVVDWVPFADTRQTVGRPREDAEEVFIRDSEKGFCPGVARSAVFQLGVGPAPAPVRYLASAEHCLLTGELALPLTPPKAVDRSHRRAAPRLSSVAALSDAARRVYLRNEMKEGFCAGGTYRYLDQHPDGRWEFSCDGNETASFFRGSYLLGDGRLFDLALRNADFEADLGCDRRFFFRRYHHANPDQSIYSLIYMRFGGLVHAHLETGDPYYLETAEGIANRWIATHSANWPRRGVGRDMEPVEGILLLYDFTGHDHYFDHARQIARDVVASLYPDGTWRSGAGVGPYWGCNALPGQPWNGSHLLAGLAEFVMRADTSDPVMPELLEGGQRLLRKWLAWLQEMHEGFHRAAIGFAWRRHWALAEIIGDEQIIRQLRAALDAAAKRFERDGETFFDKGHHCAGYIDNPWFFLARGLPGSSPGPS